MNCLLVEPLGAVVEYLTDHALLALREPGPAGAAGIALAILWLLVWRRRENHREWSIGIFEGSSPLELGDAAGVANPVLTAADVRDVSAEFVADPFLFRRDSRWYMFFEVAVGRRGTHGSIGLATSEDGRVWDYERIVLREAFHLSYPFVFETGGEIYMVPESSAAGAIRLYRARRFPEDWEFVRTLLEGRLVDPTLFHHGGKWWMFTSTPGNDELRLHFADDLLGIWKEHPASPIIRGDRRIARPAGRVVTLPDGRLVRFAQDAVPDYGTRVVAFEITRLDESGYEEAPVGRAPILGGSGSGWNMDRMHHLDAQRLGPGQWMACVDGRGQPLPGRSTSTRRASPPKDQPHAIRA